MEASPKRAGCETAAGRETSGGQTFERLEREHAGYPQIAAATERPR